MKILLFLFVYLLFNNSIAQKSEEIKGIVLDFTDQKPLDVVIVEASKSKSEIRPAWRGPAKTGEDGQSNCRLRHQNHILYEPSKIRNSKNLF